MKIASYNVNSVRQRLPIVLDWINEHRLDVMCLQETKVPDEESRKLRGMKAHDGVATLTRFQPGNIIYGHFLGIWPGNPADLFCVYLSIPNR